MSRVLDTIIARHDAFDPVKVSVPEWGVELFFTPMTPAERAKIRQGVNEDDETEMMIRFVVHKACDKDGTLVFEATPETFATLQAKAEVRVLRRILAESDGPAAAEGEDVKNG